MSIPELLPNLSIRPCRSQGGQKSVQKRRRYIYIYIYINVYKFLWRCVCVCVCVLSVCLSVCLCRCWVICFITVCYDQIILLALPRPFCWSNHAQMYGLYGCRRRLLPLKPRSP